MFEDQDEEMDEIMEGVDDNLSYGAKGGNIRRTKMSLELKRKRRVQIFWGAVILILVVVAAIFFGGRNNHFAEDLEAINARVDLLEKRLSRLGLEGMNKKAARLEGQVKALEKSVAKLNRTIAAKPKAKPAIKKKAVSKAKRQYHKVRPGETIYGIAKKYGISVDKLCRYNNFTKNQVISPGQKIWVAPGTKN